MNNPFGEQFKESNLEVKGENILTKIDDFEENIKLFKRYEGITPSHFKRAM